MNKGMFAGVLCGDCGEGSGFSALLDGCVSCDSSNAALVLVLVVADVIVVVVVLVLMVPAPSWLYPVFYYLQILPYLTQHFPITFEKLRPIVAYVGSALGLYFPYDFCLHSDMNAAAVYALRYTPPLVVTALAPIILHVRLKHFHPREWHGLWWLVLMLYTPLLHTSFSLLDCPTLRGENPFTPRWYVNANIRCFQDAAHAPLGLFAIFVVAFCISIVPFVVLVATKRLTKPYWVHCLVGPLTRPYKAKCEWWCGVELAKRLFLVLFAVAFKPNDIAVLFILVLTMALSGFFKPYKNMLVNILDVAFAVDVFVLLTLRNVVDVEEEFHSIPQQDPALVGACSDVQGFSTFVLILSPFYYLPFLLAMIAGGVWGVWHLYCLVKNRFMPGMKRKKSSRQQSGPLSPSPGPSHPRTQTVVDLNDFESGYQQQQQRKGSFNVPRIRWASRKKRNVIKTESSTSTGGVEGIPLQGVPLRGKAAEMCGEITSSLIEASTKPRDDERDSSITISTSEV